MAAAMKDRYAAAGKERPNKTFEKYPKFGKGDYTLKCLGFRKGDGKYGVFYVADFEVLASSNTAEHPVGSFASWDTKPDKAGFAEVMGDFLATFAGVNLFEAEAIEQAADELAEDCSRAVGQTGLATVKFGKNTKGNPPRLVNFGQPA